MSAINSNPSDDEDAPLAGGLITVKQAVEEYPLSAGQLRHLIAERRIPHYKMLGLSGRPHGVRLARRDLDGLFTRIEATNGA